MLPALIKRSGSIWRVKLHLRLQVAASPLHHWIKEGYETDTIKTNIKKWHWQLLPLWFVLMWGGKKRASPPDETVLWVTFDVSQCWLVITCELAALRSGGWPHASWQHLFGNEKKKKPCVCSGCWDGRWRVSGCGRGTVSAASLSVGF